MIKRKILILAGYYLPGVKGGGPIKSISNLVTNLSDKFDFYILANDRDMGDIIPFDNIQTDQWIDFNNSKIFYTNHSDLTPLKLSEIINSICPEILYLNSFFEYKLSIIPFYLNLFGVIKVKKLIIAPRGNFSKGALKIKNKKKSLYIEFFKRLKLYRKVFWQATSPNEKQDIENVFGNDVKIIQANNLTANYDDNKLENISIKVPGSLKVIFLSRIHPMKNLIFAIQIMSKLKGQVFFDVYGPIEDKSYWEKCQKEIEKLPKNIIVTYKGIVESNKTVKIFNQYHVFILPTFGENFGHVISEALIGGCILVISDRTPWKDLENEQVGWDLPLENPFNYYEVLQQCINMTEESFKEKSKNAFQLGMKKSEVKEEIKKYLDLFSL